MELEKEIKTFRKKLEHERDRRPVNWSTDAFDGNGDKPDPRKGRKLSKAHRDAIKRGLAKSKKTAKANGN